MRRAPLLALGFAACLAGCAAETPSPPARTFSAMGWGYYETPSEGAKLAYGAPETDNVALMMMCPLASGRVSVWASVTPPARPGLLVLRSGQAVTRLRARLEPDEGEGADLTGATSSRDPVLQAFAATGELIIEAGAGPFAAPARDPEPVRTFLKRCAG